MSSRPATPSNSPLLAASLGGLVGASAGLVGAMLLVLTRRAIDQGTYLTALDAVRAWQGVVLTQFVLGAVAGLAVGLLPGRLPGGRLLASLLAGVCLGLAVTDLGRGSAPSLLHQVRWFSRHLAYLEVLLLASLGTAVLFLALPPGGRRTRPRTAFLVASATLALLVLPVQVGRYLAAVSREAVQVTEVVREVVLEPETWSIEAARPDAPPAAGLLSPSRDFRLDGGELPSIRMAPPARLSFTVREEDGPSVLRFAAGADRELGSPRTRRLLDRATGGRRFGIQFQVLRNGERVFSRIEPARLDEVRNRALGQRRWLRPEGDAGLEVAPGDVITLETSLVGLPGELAERLPELPVGFGGVTLERTREVPSQASTPSAPNLVLIVQDTMRADRSSTYGYGRPTTPNLTRLADRGILYENARSTASWTWPSTASILTGLLPGAHGVVDDDACYLSDSRRTLAEALQERGLVTGAFTCNPLVSAEKNFDQGFGTFRNDPRRFVKTDEIISDVRSWIRMNRGSRFFLYLHLVDPHMPLAPLEEHAEALALPVPARFDGSIEDSFHRYVRLTLAPGGIDEEGEPVPAVLPAGHLEYISSMYDASIATGDHYLGLLLDELDELDLSDRTVVAFTSDHGEALLEHGDLGHGQSLHPELVGVPLVLAGPGLPAGVRSEVPVSNRHLASTLALIGGARLDAPHAPRMLADPASLAPHPVYASTTHGQWNYRPGRQPLHGVLDGRWSLHHAPTGTDFQVPAEEAAPGGQVRLYDLRSDPGEQHEVAADHPEVVEELRQRLSAELERQRAARGASVDLGASSATLDLLDDIGYTIGKE